MKEIFWDFCAVIRTIIREECTQILQEQNNEISKLKEEMRQYKLNLQQENNTNKTGRRGHYCSPQNIRNFRKRIAVSQQVFAKMLGVNRVSVSDWERNAVKVSNRIQMAIAELQGLDKNTLAKRISLAEKSLFE